MGWAVMSLRISISSKVFRRSSVARIGGSTAVPLADMPGSNAKIWRAGNAKIFRIALPGNQDSHFKMIR